MNLNYLAIVVATLVQFAIGAIWYMPLFGDLWRRIHGIAKPTKADDAHAWCTACYDITHNHYFGNIFSIPANLESLCNGGIFLGWICCASTSIYSVIWRNKSQMDSSKDFYYGRWITSLS